VATNAFMQYPTGYTLGADGNLKLADFWGFVLSRWALIEYAHNMLSSVVTASFVVSAVGAYYLLRGRHTEESRRFLSVGTTAGLISTLLVVFPTGDRQAKLVAQYQTPSLAAMEGRFESGPRAEIILIGQPNVSARRLDNAIRIPGMLSFLAYGTFHSEVKGLGAFPPDTWPDNIELLYYSFHIMAGLGTIMIALMALAAILNWAGRLARSRSLLWILMLAFPLPYIAVTAGWLAAELGRQPWVVYGLQRTAGAASPSVHAGTALFTLIGFCGLYFVLGVLFLFMMGREIAHGPADGDSEVAHG
jgi:cytochrome d ubiquinol oxidase subunit I